MSTPGTDAIGLLRWGLRRYAVLFYACLLLGAAVAPVVAAKLARPADAEALIIAQRLDMDLSALPRYGEAVFNNGQVAQAVVAKFGSEGLLKDVIPDRVSLVADQDSIVFTVVGHDPDPQTAAEIANTAADAFKQALNAPGAGVGAFVTQSEAEPPAQPAGRLNNVLAVPMGITAGVLLGLAVVFTLLVARRPVIDAAGVEEATGVPALGTVVVPRTGRGRFAPPDRFAGLVPVCRRLLRLPTSTIVILSRRREAGIRHQLSVALATVLMRVRDVSYLGQVELPGSRAARDSVQDPSTPVERLPVPEDDHITFVDSSDAMDLVHPPEETATVLVAREGVSSASLRAAVVEHLGGSAEARIILVKRGRRVRGEPLPPAGGPQRPRRDVALADGR
jgi:capsular polysaccharide biosynthesis protein